METQYKSKIIAKGDVGEECLNCWFQENGITYFPVNQNIQSFMHTFAETMKRPDFFVLLESIGMIAVDAKNYKLSYGYYTLNKQELLRALSYEIITKMPFWFAYLNQDKRNATWYWISALKALDVGRTRINSVTGEEFLAISLSDFITVREQCDFCKLLNHRSQFEATIISTKHNN